MAIFASLVARLGFDTSEWSAGTQKAKRDLKGVDTDAKKFFADLRADFGRTSALGQASRLFMATGALGGVAQAGHALAEFSGKLADVADKFHDGKMSGGEFAKTIGESIPVLGGFFKTGENIVEMVTHWEAKQKALDEAYKKSNEIWNKEVETTHELHENHTKFIDDLERINKEKSEQNELDSQITDEQRDLFKLTIDRTHAMDDLQEKYKQYEKEQSKWNDDASARLKSAILSPSNTEAQRIQRQAMISAAQAEQDLRLKQEKEAAEAITSTKLAIESEYQHKRADVQADFLSKDLKKAQEAAEKEAKAKEEITKKAKEQSLRDREAELQDDISKIRESHEAHSVHTENMRFGGVVSFTPQIVDPGKEQRKAAVAELKAIRKELQDMSRSTGGDEAFNL